jgi:heme oxygenase
VGRAHYLAHLEQLYLLHQALEGALDQAAAARPEWAGLTLGDRRRVPDLSSDLEVLGGNLAPVPLPETQRAVEVIGAAAPHRLLGMFYVTEGSTNGGRFLTKMVAKALSLDPATNQGLRAQNPYGDEQPARWAAFKGAMNALSFSPLEVAELEAGARDMFDLMADVAEGVKPA